MKKLLFICLVFMLINGCKLGECVDCEVLKNKDTYIKCYIEAHDVHYLRPGELIYREKDSTFILVTKIDSECDPVCTINFRKLQTGSPIPITHFYYQYYSSDDYSSELESQNTGWINFTKIDSINHILEGNFESYIGDFYSEGKVSDGSFKVSF